MFLVGEEKNVVFGGLNLEDLELRPAGTVRERRQVDLCSADSVWLWKRLRIDNSTYSERVIPVICDERIDGDSLDHPGACIISKAAV